MSVAVKTYMAKGEEVVPSWYIVDADSQIVGRLATKLATILMGKHKPTYTPHVDCGDCLVVINAEKICFSGKPLAHPDYPNFTTKMLKKTYEKYTGYPGGRHITTAAVLLDSHPERILTEAVRRMLPKNKLGRKMLSKLKVYRGPDHPHQAQNPIELPEHLKTK